MFKRSLFCTALLGFAAILGPAAALAAPLAPFVLRNSGPAEIKYTGYMAKSNDTGSAGLGVGLRESTFAAGYMTSINALGNPARSYWQQGQSNQSISFMMYGIADAATMRGTGSFGNQVYSVGCTNAAFGCDGKIHLDFYLDQMAGGTNPGFEKNGLKASDRTGFGQMAGITDGQLLMRWEFVPGLINTPVDGISDSSFATGSTTLFQDVSSIAFPANGSSTYLAKCASGPACAYFRTQSQAGGADFFGINTITAMMANSGLGRNGWGSRLADPVITQIQLPEPGVLGLLAIGLLGLAGARRHAAAQDASGG